jgi:hypothetical protein
MMLLNWAGVRLGHGSIPRWPGLSIAALVLFSLPASAQDFWKHWGDGKAELNGYRLAQPRYGEVRAGTAVLIFVTENMSDTLRVKADPGKHPESDLYPVLKLNQVRHFQTGIYDYNVMTSAFLRIAAGWPVAKLSFSSQEWCGQVYHQLLPRDGKLSGVIHSYFDGEADGTEQLSLPQDGVFEDALAVLVRDWNGPWLRPGESRSVPFLPSLMRSRLEHRPLAWGRARVSRAAAASNLSVPAGRFKVSTFTVEVEGGSRLTFEVEEAAPYRLVRWTGGAGEEAVLLGSARLPYWQLNQPGGEKALRELGLSVR